MTIKPLTKVAMFALRAGPRRCRSSAHATGVRLMKLLIKIIIYTIFGAFPVLMLLDGYWGLLILLYIEAGTSEGYRLLVSTVVPAVCFLVVSYSFFTVDYFGKIQKIAATISCVATLAIYVHLFTLPEQIIGDDLITYLPLASIASWLVFKMWYTNETA